MKNIGGGRAWKYFIMREYKIFFGGQTVVSSHFFWGGRVPPGLTPMVATIKNKDTKCQTYCDWEISQTIPFTSLKVTTQSWNVKFLHKFIYAHHEYLVIYFSFLKENEETHFLRLALWCIIYIYSFTLNFWSVKNM